MFCVLKNFVCSVCILTISFSAVGIFLLLLLCLFSVFTTMLQLASRSMDYFSIARDMVTVE